MKRWTWVTLPVLLGVSLLFVDSTPTQAKSWSKRGWLGVEVQSVDRQLAEAFDLKSEYGVVINDITIGSPADEAGLEESDVIIKVNNERIVDADDLSETITDLEAGEKVTITYIRDGQEKLAQVTLDHQPKSRYYYGHSSPRSSYSYTIPPTPPMPDMPPMPPMPAVPAMPKWNTNGYAYAIDDNNTSGIEVIELSQGLQEFLGVTSHGAFVTDVDKHSEAAKAGVKAGDVIIRAENDKISDPSDLYETLSDFEEGDTVSLTVVRAHKEMTIKMEVEEDSHGFRLFSGSTAPRARGLYLGNGNGFGSSYDINDLNEDVAKLRSELDRQRKNGDMDRLQQDLQKLREELKALEEKMK